MSDPATIRRIGGCGDPAGGAHGQAAATVRPLSGAHQRSAAAARPLPVATDRDPAGGAHGQAAFARPGSASGRSAALLARAAVCFALSLACFAAGVALYHSLSSAIANTATFAVRGTPVPHESAASLCATSAEKGLSAQLVFWSQTPGEAAAAPASSPFAPAASLRYCGDAGLLLPDAPAYYAGLGDGGSDMAADIRPLEPACFAEPGGAGVSYDRITTSRLDADGFPVSAEALAPALGTELDLLDYRVLSFASYAVLLLCPLRLAVQASRLLRRSRSARSPVGLQALGYAVPCIAALAATAAFAFSLSVFGEYLPTRWSDFAAWGDAAAAAAQGFARVVFSAQTIIDEPVMIAWVLSVVAGIASLACIGATATRFELWDQRKQLRGTNEVNAWHSSN